MLCEAILVLSFLVADGTRQSAVYMIKDRAEYKDIIGTIYEGDFLKDSESRGVSNIRQEILIRAPKPFYCGK